MPARRTTARGANRIKRALRAMEMDEATITLCGELIANVGFLEDQLYNARIDLAGQPIIMAYDNGGGQSGTRKNPGLEAYARLYQQYLQGLRALIDRLPDASVADVVDTSAADAMEALRRAERERSHG